MDNVTSFIPILKWFGERLRVAIATYLGWLRSGILGDTKSVAKAVLMIHVGVVVTVSFWSVTAAIVAGLLCILHECMLCGWLRYLFDTS